MADDPGKTNLDEAKENENFQHRFLVLRKLGQGTYGKVQLAFDKHKKKEVAIKTIKKAKIENIEDMRRIRREIYIMSSLRHPHIIHINEVFETRQRIVIVMQYASGGELYDYLGSHECLPENEARRLFRQIASAIYYCHKNQICHRDLKLENILLDEQGNALIADFGLSNVFDDNTRINTFCGSPLYASPEIVKGTPYKGPEVDCWSLGVLLYTLVYGTMPFDGRNFKDLVLQISEGRYKEPINRSNASGLIRRLLTPEIEKRATIVDVCKDNWVNYSHGYPFLETAENMATTAAVIKQQLQVCDATTKHGRGKILYRTASSATVKAKNFTPVSTVNNSSFDPKNKVTQMLDQTTNCDVCFVLNKIFTTVENLSKENKNNYTINSKECRDNRSFTNYKNTAESAELDNIFKVASIVQNPVYKWDVEKNKQDLTPISTEINKTAFNYNTIRTESNKDQVLISDKVKMNSEIERFPSMTAIRSQETERNSTIKTNDNQRIQNLLRDSQNNNYDFFSHRNKIKPGDTNQKLKEPQNLLMRHPSLKSKRHENMTLGKKQTRPFIRTTHHVLNLACLLSLNYERKLRNSFRLQTEANKKKIPGKITIPATFDPNYFSKTINTKQEEKKELFIFPMVSVSENKQKIEKKIERIKKAALNKNLVIRSDSKTRLRIEKYILSQVKRLQDMVSDEQSIRESLEHLEEQSIRDMSEMYYRAFGSENTDSGIANNEEEEFCFLCSNYNERKSFFNDSSMLESLKKGNYTSNHLHIVKPKSSWSYASNNQHFEYGTLSRCKSEIKFPNEYLNYISFRNKSRNIDKHFEPHQSTKSKYFLGAREVGIKNKRIFRSASDSVKIQLMNNAFEILKIDSENDQVSFDCSTISHLLEQDLTVEQTKHGQVSNKEYQSGINALIKDDGIGDSKDSFQSDMDIKESKLEEWSSLLHSKSLHCLTKAPNEAHTPSLKRLSSEPQIKRTNSLKISNDSKIKKKFNTPNHSSHMNLGSESTTLQGMQQDGKKTLKRRNTISHIHRNTEFQYNDHLNEVESNMWNGFKDRMFETMSFSSNQRYTLDKNSKFKSRDFDVVDYFTSRKYSDASSLNDSDDYYSDSYRNKIDGIRNSHVTYLNSLQIGNSFNKHIGQTNSVAGEIISEDDQRDITQKLKSERYLSKERNRGKTAEFFENFLNAIEKQERNKTLEKNKEVRQHSPKSSKPQIKKLKSQYKQSFLQLIALKRIQEAEKELDKSPSSDLDFEENSGSLLEQLKTQGYKSVISQRFQQEHDSNLTDHFYTKNLKFRNLRAELSELNNMYYDYLTKYSPDTYAESDNCYDNLNYYSLRNGYSCNGMYDSRQNGQRQCVFDWLNTNQLNTNDFQSVVSNASNVTDEMLMNDVPNYISNWEREQAVLVNDVNTTESLKTLEEAGQNGATSCWKTKEDSEKDDLVNCLRRENTLSNILKSDDEKVESVQERIWRKSFYSRFNNRALSRKGERTSYIEPEFLNSRYDFHPKSHNGSHLDQILLPLEIKRPKKYSSGFDRSGSRSSREKSLSNQTLGSRSSREKSLSNQTLGSRSSREKSLSNQTLSAPNTPLNKGSSNYEMETN